MRMERLTRVAMVNWINRLIRKMDNYPPIISLFILKVLKEQYRRLVLHLLDIAWMVNAHLSNSEPNFHKTGSLYVKSQINLMTGVIFPDISSVHKTLYSCLFSPKKLQLLPQWRIPPGCQPSGCGTPPPWPHLLAWPDRAGWGWWWAWSAACLWSWTLASRTSAERRTGGRAQ